MREKRRSPYFRHHSSCVSQGYTFVPLNVACFLFFPHNSQCSRLWRGKFRNRLKNPVFRRVWANSQYFVKGSSSLDPFCGVMPDPSGKIAGCLAHFCSQSKVTSRFILVLFNLWLIAFGLLNLKREHGIDSVEPQTQRQSCESPSWRA